MFSIERLDHLVLTVRDLARSIDFYVRVLGMEEQSFAGSDGVARTALRFGRGKINLHEAGREFEPKAAAPAPGTADLCFITEAPLARVMAHLEACGVALLLPPSRRTGALGPIESIYLRDPDGNLIEISNYSAG
jgi:catechol 2,3-dioxygenase-like lactoylglutathione lyase family enzyme